MEFNDPTILRYSYHLDVSFFKGDREANFLEHLIVALMTAERVVLYLIPVNPLLRFILKTLVDEVKTDRSHFKLLVDFVLAFLHFCL